MDENHLTLVVPNGGESGLISHGEKYFVPYREDHLNPASKWLVDVPREIAAHLTGRGGFLIVGPVDNEPPVPAAEHRRALDRIAELEGQIASQGTGR
jgi:hypothetical protein